MREGVGVLTIDGSFGEGGGQILRTSLALSAVTGKPFTIEKIRSGRAKPGLMRQHLTAVNAAAEVCGADVMGAKIGSQTLTFKPGKVRAGKYRFSIGTAGSATLVCQTVLPALLMAEGESEVHFEGGTHNPWAPPHTFLKSVFLPVLERVGVQAHTELKHYGFFPAGGGTFTLQCAQWNKRKPLELLERGELKTRFAKAIIANLPSRIAANENRVLKDAFNLDRNELHVEEVENSSGPGNVVMLTLTYEHVAEVFTGFGRPGVPADRVAKAVVKEAKQYMTASAPVGKYLADQLLIPMALAGGGEFRTVSPTRHTKTNIEMVQKFLDVKVILEKEQDKVWRVKMSAC